MTFTCAHCGVTFEREGDVARGSSRARVPIPVEEQRNLECCDAGCANAWARNEAARLRGWLSRIASRTRGMGADLATQALYSNAFVDGSPSRKGMRK